MRKKSEQANPATQIVIAKAAAAVTVTPAGYRYGQYAVLCGMSRAHLYAQPIQPDSIVLSRRKNGRAAVRIIVEQPSDYLRRLATHAANAQPQAA